MKKIGLVKDRVGFWELYLNVLQEYDCEVVLLNPFEKKDLDLILKADFDFFIWRAKHNPRIKTLARRIFYLLNIEKGIPTFPSYNVYWHYDDKVAQYFLAEEKEIPMPETNVFYSLEETCSFLERADYPLIFKSAYGAGSSNVGLFYKQRKAISYAKKVFKKGVDTFFKGERQKGYVYLQEFMKNNKGDYRLVCYGNEIMGYFRNNRKDSPFASGSHDESIVELDPSLLELVWQCNQKLGADVMSYDAMIGNDGQWNFTEFSVIYNDIKDDVLNHAYVYQRNDNGWSKVGNTGNHHKRMMKYLTRKWSLDV